MNSASTLWTRLLQLGAVSGPLPEDHGIPWSVRILLGLGAWLASLFALGFVGVTLHGMLSESGPRLVLAGIAGAVAFVLAPQAATRPFAGQVGLVLACLMQLLMLWSLLDDVRDLRIAGVALMAIGAVSLLIPTFLWRLWNCWVVVVGMGVLLVALEVPYAMAVLVAGCASGCAALWLYPAAWLSWQRPLRPVALGLGIAALGMTLWNPGLGWATALLLEMSPGSGPDLLAALCTAALALVNSAVVLVLAQRLAISAQVKAGAVLLVLLVAASSWSTPAVSAALGLLILGYGRGLPLLTVLGVVGLLAGLSAHYYGMSWSLNLKALSMVCLGVLLLAARSLLLRAPTQPGTRR